MRKLSLTKIDFDDAIQFSYFLPYEYSDDDTDDFIINKTVDLLKTNCYIIERKDLKVDGKYILISYIYEGSTSYYNFKFKLEVVKSDYNKLILLGTIHQDIHDLFEEIIMYTIIPKWSEDLGFVLLKRN